MVCVYSDSPLQDKENLYKSWSRKLYNFGCAPGKPTNSAAVPGVSIAMDSRLENGIEMCAELRLRVCSKQHASKEHYMNIDCVCKQRCFIPKFYSRLLVSCSTCVLIVINFS